MADQRRVTGASMTSFEEAAAEAFSLIPGDPHREGLKAAEVSRLWLTGGGVVGVPVYNAELRSLGAAAHEGVDSPRETWSCDDWYAYLNIMPGTRPTLRVGATCTARTTGYRFALARQNTQGINPKDLLLHLVIEVPTPGTTVEDVVTEYHVQYVEHTDMRYDSVSIVPGGPTLEVKIVQ